MLRFFMSVCVWSAATVCCAEPDFIDPVPLDEKVLTSVSSVKSASDGRVRVPIITWGADIATLLANGNALSPQPGSMMAAAGLNYELVHQDSFDKQLSEYLSGQSPYLRCTIGMCNQAIDALTKDDRTRPVVIHQMTWSRGGDTLVAKDGVMKVSQLKGKSIAIQAYGPHVDFLTALLDKAGMKASDVNLKWMADLTLSPNSPPEVLGRSDVDAAFMIVPDADVLTSGRRTGTGKDGSVRGARMIISTMYARRVIADVYVVREDYFRNHRAEVERFVGVLIKAEEQLTQMMQNVNNPETLGLLHASAGILLGDDNDTMGIENLYYDAEFVDKKGNYEFLQSDNFPHRVSVLNENAQKAFVGLGLIKSSASMSVAQWDYGKF